MIENDRRDARVRRERHISTGLILSTFLTLLTFGWKGAAYFGELNAHLRDIDVKQLGAYTTHDARRDFAELSARITRGDVKDETHDARLDAIEKTQRVVVHRLDTLERASIGLRAKKTPRPPDKVIEPQPVKEPDE